MSREKTTERVERLLIEAILGGTFPPGSALPGERALSKELGVARPALREALQRLHRDGWLDIQQGRSTRVNDFMQEGDLALLARLLKTQSSLLPTFVPRLLEVWEVLAPVYTRQAVLNAPEKVVEQVEGYRGMAARPEFFARAQWRLHRALAEWSGNVVYALVLNGFADFYVRFATQDYAEPAQGAGLCAFWGALADAARCKDAGEAAALVAGDLAAQRARWSGERLTAWLEVIQAQEAGREAEEKNESDANT
ncbi:MAG: GntR family transcriptional regulator [Chloroflexota bacterium]|jgi:GntR family transcriptional regulator, negative regulator for fad regulon and positive regulator of fabA